MKSYALALSSFAVLTTVASAEAREGRASALSWSRLPGAESCPASRDVARAVEARLGRSVFVPPARAELTVEGYVRPNEGRDGFHATVQIVDVGGAILGTRELESGAARCSDLSGPLSLAVALMVDPEAEMVAKPEPELVTAKVQASEPMGVFASPTADRSAPPEPPRRSATPVRLQVSGGPAISGGFMPSIAAGAELSVLMDPDGLPALQVSGAVWPGHRSNGARYTLAYGGVALCPFVGDTVVGRLGACAGMAVGAMAGSVGAPADLYYVAAHPFVDLRGAWRLVGPLIATGGLSVAIPLYRPTFNYSSGHRMAPVAGIAMMGIGMEVP